MKLGDTRLQLDPLPVSTRLRIGPLTVPQGGPRKNAGKEVTGGL